MSSIISRAALRCAGAALVGFALPGGHAGVAAADPVEVHGALGFGLGAERRSGGFEWDFGAAHAETTLAQLQLGVRPAAGLLGFVHFGARLDATHDAPGARFELREAAVLYAHRFTDNDSLRLRAFARQPSVLWLDHGIAPPIDPRLLGDDVQGVRADVHSHTFHASVIAADPSRFDADAGTPDRKDIGLALARLRADLAYGVRVGATWLREHPDAAFLQGDPAAVDASRRDVVGMDARWFVGGTLLQLQFDQSDADYADPAAAAIQQPGVRSGWDWNASHRVTDVIPTTAQLRVEARAPRLGNPRWGWFGFAPRYRAVGEHFTNRWSQADVAAGTPRRGYEGYTLEAWYSAAGWPVWFRQLYDRQVQFRDANRTSIRQVSEVWGWVHPQVRARAQYTQRQTHEPDLQHTSHDDDLLLEVATHVERTRVRAQMAVLDVNAVTQGEALSLEVAAGISGNLQAVGRTTLWRELGGVRSSLFVELQYWSLPQFEAALAYGPGWAGDQADPALDPDLGSGFSEQVRLHVRGWF